MTDFADRVAAEVDQHREAVELGQAFGVFRTLAEAFASGDGHEHKAEAAEQLLQGVVARYADSDRNLVAHAIDEYVAGAVPFLVGQGRDQTWLRDLVRMANVSELLANETVSALVELEGVKTRPPSGWTAKPVKAKWVAGARSSEASSRGGAKEAVPPEAAAIFQRRDDAGGAGPAAPEDETSTAAPGDGAPKPRMDDGISEVTYDEILKECIGARKRGRKVVLVVGLATAGKSFFVRRLKRTLGSRYDVMGQRGVPAGGAEFIDRTMSVLRHYFEIKGRPTSRKNFDVYDVPGDEFNRVVKTGFQIGDESQNFIKLFYAIAAYADALVFVAPAFQVLMPKDYVRDGDNLGLNLEERRARVQDTETFVGSLAQMAKAIGLLRRQVEVEFGRQRKAGKRGDEARAAAVTAAVEKIVQLTFNDITNARSARLAMPSILLLSQSDELLSRIGREKFDYDPTFQLLKRADAHLHGLASRFDSFSVDFLTAVKGHVPGEEFDPDKPGFGAAGLIENWLLPAISHSRGWSPTKALERPRVALWLRRHLDPDFNAAWGRGS